MDSVTILGNWVQNFPLVDRLPVFKRSPRHLIACERLQCYWHWCCPSAINFLMCDQLLDLSVNIQNLEFFWNFKNFSLINYGIRNLKIWNLKKNWKSKVWKFQSCINFFKILLVKFSIVCSWIWDFEKIVKQKIWKYPTIIQLKNLSVKI